MAQPIIARTSAISVASFSSRGNWCSIFAAEKVEREQAEQARREAEEKARQEQLAAWKAEQEERAKRQAEEAAARAVEQERQRVAAQEAAQAAAEKKRAESKRRREKVHAEITAALIAATGATQDHANEIVAALTDGRIPHVAVNY
ncbi:hypothetical protein AB8Z38_04560 [Bradyrhizobium sp. LLZ17]|uniref:Uncharacterized protein n=1 Tax=Bradyrhizobium sp. LLZ17 TaxID=3239388 RepID=A0AB39XLH4_9BRAD